MAFLDPQYNIQQFQLKEGMTVADLGSGTGFYTMEAAKIVGSEGRVYAVDVQKDFLEKIKNSANSERLFNIEVIWGDIENLGGTKLADSSIDAVILSNILFQIEEKENLILETKRILHPKGKILFVDWSGSYGGLGPAPESIFTEDQALKLFEKKGFVVDKKIDAGDNHYGIIFKRNLTN